MPETTGHLWSMFSGEETDLQRLQGRGSARKAVCLEPGRGSRTEETQGLQVIYLTPEAPAPSDRTALEGVVKRGFVELV